MVRNSKVGNIGDARKNEVSQNRIADQTAQLLAHEICLDPITERYYQREDGRDVWHPISKIKAEATIEQTFAPWVSSYTASFLNSIIRLLRTRIVGSGWTNESHLVPMENGIFNLRNGVLLPYQEDYLFNWRLPYPYEPKATCPKTEAWLNYVARGDEDLIWFLICWMSAVLTGRYDLQKFLVIVGHGGTGKGTLFRLVTQLIGKENVWVTTMKRLEHNQYETSNLYGKRLTVITDAENFAGEINTVKGMTGEDNLPYERKYKDQEESFLYKGMVMIAANHYLKPSDKTSAVFRRMISVLFNRIASEEAKALNPNFEKGLSEELPGLFNKLAAIPRNEATKTIRNLAPSIAASKLEAEIETNPIMAWAHERLVVCNKGQETPIGQKPMSGDMAEPSRLYGDYIRFCECQGNREVALRNFSKLVIDNCVARGVRTCKTRQPGQGSTVLEGLRLRTTRDTDPYLFVKDSEASTQIGAHASEDCEACEVL